MDALNAVAKERIIRDAEKGEAFSRGFMKGAEALLPAMGQLVNQAAADWQTRQAALANALADTSDCITDGFGPYSSIDVLLRKERFSAKGACVDFVKANPACTEDEAIAAWTAGGLAATGLTKLLTDPHVLAVVYRQNLVAAGLAPDDTWESQRAWLVATDRAAIMGV